MNKCVFVLPLLFNLLRKFAEVELNLIAQQHMSKVRFEPALPEDLIIRSVILKNPAYI